MLVVEAKWGLVSISGDPGGPSESTMDQSDN